MPSVVNSVIGAPITISQQSLSVWLWNDRFSSGRTTTESRLAQLEHLVADHHLARAGDHQVQLLGGRVTMVRARLAGAPCGPTPRTSPAARAGQSRSREL